MKNQGPPIAVVAAAWILLAYCLISFGRIWLFGSGLPSSVSGIVAWALVLACFIFVARSLYVGRNWLRWLLAASVAIAMVVIPWQKPEIPDGPQLGIYLLQFIMPIAACALTFTRRARAWFRS